MEDKVTEKIYCYDHPSAYNRNDGLAIASMFANRREECSPYAIAAMMKDNHDPYAAAAANGFNNQWNNPMMYLVWMWMMRWMNGNGYDTQDPAVQRQLQTLQQNMQDNHNSDLIMQGIAGNTDAIREAANRMQCDFNALNQAVCGVQSSVQALSGQIGFSAERVINAAERGDCQVIQALKDCCCGTQKAILEMGYQNQLAICGQTRELRDGQRDLGVAIAQGFSQVGFRQEQNKCDIINAGHADTQRIIDTLNNHWNTELSQRNQDLKFEISQLRQNQYLAGVITGNNNGGCGCNNGCGL